MVLYPEVQKRAQEEIDKVVGTDRLPDFQDRASLPYLEAVYRETMRLKPVGPIGVPHAATNEDVYKGYYIPKGKAMSQNPVKYPDPSAFKPERFLDSEGKLNDDTVTYAFGFGRRICPGRHFASGSSWIAMANILASFSIGKAKDAAGNPIDCEPDWYLAIST
ncbi:cytochrome P450 [Coniophora puteana RWD-64-598 SS2]|uniref:Cytochrome P450 n=1 Tax=Coniophora puteana (strain RWD-64-598) TaxID=741705 RepID=A0A5M3N199_CONPW|nr:cytochrome P450 [Coniophora puteana RWD-64-598 SS2]EIW84794.1 cytochrome P450 [Coniophora puteana RWD-64-598 SS2]